MNKDGMKISVPSAAVRERCATVEDWKQFFNGEEICEIVHRYCNTQDASKKYRQGAAEKAKALKAWAVAQGLDLGSL